MHSDEENYINYDYNYNIIPGVKYSFFCCCSYYFYHPFIYFIPIRADYMINVQRGRKKNNVRIDIPYQVNASCRTKSCEALQYIKHSLCCVLIFLMGDTQQTAEGGSAGWVSVYASTPVCTVSVCMLWFRAAKLWSFVGLPRCLCWWRKTSTVSPLERKQRRNTEWVEWALSGFSKYLQLFRSVEKTAPHMFRPEVFWWSEWVLTGLVQEGCLRSGFKLMSITISHDYCILVIYVIHINCFNGNFLLFLVTGERAYPRCPC